MAQVIDIKLENVNQFVDVGVNDNLVSVNVQLQGGYVLGEKGEQGIQGIDGLSAYEVAVANGYTGTEEEWLATLADKNYVHSQNVASDLWSITHNLNKYPSVTVIDSANSSVEGTISYINLNTVEVSFNGGFTGKALIN